MELFLWQPKEATALLKSDEKDTLASLSHLDHPLRSQLGERSDLELGMGVENLWEKRPYLQHLGSTPGHSTEETGTARTVRWLSPCVGHPSGLRNCS